MLMRHVVLGASLVLALVGIFSYSQTQHDDVSVEGFSEITHSQPLTVKQTLHTQPEADIVHRDTSLPFQLYSGLKTVFDTLILESGAFDPVVILSGVPTYCATVQYSNDACELFKELFNRYLNYKIALFTLEQETVNYSSMVSEVQYRLDKVITLRFDYFTENEIQTLFAFDDALDDSALERLKLASDPSLTNAEKKDLIAHHFATLPADEKEAFAPSLQVQKLLSLSSSGASQSHKLEQIRAEFGEDADLRIAESWQKDAVFKQRVFALKNQLKGLSDTEKFEVLTGHFSIPEAKRARVLLEQ